VFGYTKASDDLCIREPVTYLCARGDWIVSCDSCGTSAQQRRGGRAAQLGSPVTSVAEAFGAYALPEAMGAGRARRGKGWQASGQQSASGQVVGRVAQLGSPVTSVAEAFGVYCRTPAGREIPRRFGEAWR
jgi:hypothetical protein